VTSGGSGRRLRTVVGLAAIVTVAATSLGVWTMLRPPELRRDPGLSVLLVTIDTLRADAVGAYGAAGAVTPWMDRLAREGVRFESAHAHNVVTLPSHANILSGRYPLDHRVRDNAGFRFPRDTETLATLLKARGYRTGAFVSAFPLDSRFGLARGFDTYDDRFGDSGAHTAFFIQERRGSETVAAARAWLEGQGGAPTFCWVHVFEPHFPYEPPEPFASRFLADLYNGEVSAADAALGPLLEPLLRAGSRGRTLVVLTADHGEALGEHGEMSHGIFAYESTLRVPLVLYQPRILRPRVVAEPVRHVDLLPTVLDALSLAAPEGLPGRSLLPVAFGGSPPPSTHYFESLSAAMNRGWAPLRGVIRDRMKYIELPIAELYDLADDPRETRNLAAARPQELEQMRGLLAGLREADRGVRRGEEGAEVRERLRSLGYITSAAPAMKERYTDEDDPKRLIALDAAIQEVVARYTSGDRPGALALCQDIVHDRPDMPLALLYLAFLQRETGDLTAAAEAGRRALAGSPEDTDTAALVGAYLTEGGRAKEAVRLLEPYARHPEPDLDVLIAWGVALASTGQPQQALAAFEQVRQIDPSNAMALVNIGTVHLVTGEPGRAREAFESALRLDPAVARAHNSLGVIAAEGRRFEEAIERWRRAASLDPREYQTLYNLGMMLVRLGRPTEARPYLERYVREAPPALEARDIARVRAWLGDSPAAANSRSRSK
jgi:arylsulfatase A-like enzyme/Flp pilus assembly protein TadD